ncbi:hypothetical protein EU527_08315 [Candidatus Thorarchaeota archaeon]|nr:MAG: hypothetical protein EU527_08315 [Candidatus Thorarchaeota archaeon]
MTEKEKEHALVRYLSLVRKEGGEPIIGIPYREMSVDPDLVASFVLAVIIFENRQLKTFTKEGYVVVIEEGEHVVGLLIIDRVEDDEPYRSALISLIEHFERLYESQLLAWKGDIRPFREYALNILQIFPYRTFSLEMIPRMVTKTEATPDHQVSIPWSVGETDEKIQTVIGFINGKRTIEEILAQSEYEDSEILAILSMLDKYKWITLTKKLEDSSVLKKIMDPPKFLIGVYGEQLTSIVDKCDGTKTLAEICEALPYNMEAVKLVAKNLIDSGVLGICDGLREDEMQ